MGLFGGGILGSLFSELDGGLIIGLGLLAACCLIAFLWADMRIEQNKRDIEQIKKRDDENEDK